MSRMRQTSDLLIFTRQFSAMIRSNLQLVSALESLEKDTPRGALRSALKDVLEKVRTGDDFHRALSDHPRIFDAAYVGVVRAGMQSGELGSALQQISDFLDNQATVHEGARTHAQDFGYTVAIPIDLQPRSYGHHVKHRVGFMDPAHIKGF